MSLFGGGPKPPEMPPFNPLELWGKKGIATKALDQDIRRYFNMQFPVFPGMMDLRQKEIEDAYSQLTSPLSKDFSNTFLKNATVAGQGVTGGGNPFSGMGLQKGSFNRGAMTASVARQTMAKEDYDRARFENLLQMNPIPQLGLSQNDMLALTIYNTGAQNSWNMANYANQIAGANASYASMQNDFNTIGNLISGMGSIYGNYQMGNYG